MLEHVLHDALRQEELGADVDVKQRVELLALHFEEGLVESDPRIVHQAVDSAQELDGLFGQRAASST